MTLKEIHDGIEKAFTSESCMRLDGVNVIKHRGGRTWIEKEFLIRHGSIIRMILREIKELKKEEI